MKGIILKTDTYLRNKGVIQSNDTHNFILDGVDERLEFFNQVYLSFTDGFNDLPFTVSARLKPDLLGINVAIVSKQGSGSTDHREEYSLMIRSDNTISFAVFTDANAKHLFAQTATTLINNQWVVITATYDGSELVGGLEIYIDGILSTNNRLDSGLYTGMNQHTVSTLFGSRLVGANLKGNISGISFYNKVLPQIEITKLVNGKEPSKIEGCIFNMKAGDRPYWDGVTWTCPDYNRSTIPTASINMEASDRQVN